MREESVALETTDGVTLEGSLWRQEGPQGAVICHPHPLYGGSMTNNVVLAVRDRLSGLNITTLRFNFRGVGGSEGEYDRGCGEQRDVGAAVVYLVEHVEIVHIVAYSFGAWVALNAVTGGDLTPSKLILISPPVAFDETDFSALTLPAVPTLIVTGDQDQFGPPAALDQWLASQNRGDDVQRKLLAGVDHFYFGGEAELTSAIEAFLTS